MIRPAQELLRIASAGGGFTLDGSRYSADDLVEIVSAVRRNGSRVHITRCLMKSTDDLVRIAAAGKGCVTFEV